MCGIQNGFSIGIIFCFTSTLLLVSALSTNALLHSASPRISPLCIPPKQLCSGLSLQQHLGFAIPGNKERYLLGKRYMQSGLFNSRQKKSAVLSPSSQSIKSLNRRYAILRRKVALSRKDLDQTSSFLQSLGSGENTTENEGLSSLRVDQKFITAVQELKGAAKNMTSSVETLRSTVFTEVPGILKRIITALVSRQMRDDIERRKLCYVSDWTDAFRNKRQCVPAILFLYFACLAPIVSFGTIASQITDGTIGVVEFFLASGGAGMAYSIFSGQPMAFIAPTGLTLAFISSLFRFCSLRSIPFFPVYSWVGLWTAFFMVMLGIQGSSRFIRYCTRFTDEIFNGLLSFNFIYEACSSLRRNFMLADPMNLSMPFISLSIALGTFWSTMQTIGMQTSIYFNKKIRQIANNFGPVAIIFGFSTLNNLQWVKKFQVPTLAVPGTFQLAGERSLLVAFSSASIKTRILCSFPALLLTSLFFMDQNISTRVVNNPNNKLKKGEAYNLDMVALGLITGVLSIFGLPWMCGATVQSMNHVRALSTVKINEESGDVEVDEVIETRSTGFLIHAMIAGTIRLLPMLRYLPIPVVSGVFLFLGRKLMTNNRFLRRIKDAFAEKKYLPADHEIWVIGRMRMNIFTSIQLLCLWSLWNFKQNSATAIFFPGAIGILMLIRSFILPRFFSEKELAALGDPIPQ